MSFAANILNPGIEKNGLVVLRPRRRVTGWESLGSNVYRVSFSFGYVTGVWSSYANNTGLSLGTSESVAPGEYYYDHANRLLYVGSLSNPDASLGLAGRTVEYELNLATKAFTGPRDPLNGGSAVVDWIPALIKMPLAQVGSRDVIFGFNPLNSSNLEIANDDGWLSEHLHASTFKNCYVKAYVMADKEYEVAVTQSNIKAIFLGYTAAMRWVKDERRSSVSVNCVDFFKILDRPIEMKNRFTSANFANVDPAASQQDGEFWVRRIRGMLDGHVPVNVDYDATPSTSNNRDWITNEGDNGVDDGSLGYTIDDGAANTATRTYFTTTPKVRVGDWMIFSHSSGPVIVGRKITAVDRVNNYVEHASITRTVSALDTATRDAVCAVFIEADSVLYELQIYRDYRGNLNLTVDGEATAARGFRLEDNFEANLSGFPSPFDPSIHRITCRVYGQKELGSYSDSSQLGEQVDEGGIDASAESVIYQLLRSAGIPAALIDENSFQNIAADAMPVGLCIPESAGSYVGETYRDVIGQILKSMIWKLGFVPSGNDVKIGLIAVQPFVAAGDYELDELGHYSLDYEHDYSDIFKSVILEFNSKEFPLISQFSEFSAADSDMARDLHFESQVYQDRISQYVSSDAQTIADRLSYVLGDRRGFYRVVTGVDFIDKANLGASFDLIRKNLPGFQFVYPQENERQLSVIEVQKSSRGVTLTLEDQKGIQDNAGDW